ncbi:MAG TPA: hypothetical protein VIV40_37900 [Kofleriaceae bacterium]
MKLFAVAILASAPTASAGTRTQASQPARGSAAKAATAIDWSSYIDIAAIKPRELANGRAAVGNTGGKPMPSFVDVEPTPEQQALLAASLAYEAAQREPIVLSPRLLANARPACGNTGGKVDRPDDCSTAEIRAVEAADKAYAQAAGKRQAKISATYERLMSATTLAVRADPSLRARLLINGRPACGNTMGKQSPPAFCRGDEGDRQ